MSAAPLLFFILLGLLAAWVVGRRAYPSGPVREAGLAWALVGPEWQACPCVGRMYCAIEFEGRWYAYCFEGRAHKRGFLLDGEGDPSPDLARLICEDHWRKGGEAL